MTKKRNIVFFVGGFKPPHMGHCYLINSLAEIYKNTNDKLYISIGPHTREGVTLEDSLQIWNMLPLNKRVRIEKTNTSPMFFIFNYLFNVLPPTSNDNIIIANSACPHKFGKSFNKVYNTIEKYKHTPTKNGNTIPKNITLINNKHVFELKYKNRTDQLNNTHLSSRILRNDVRNNDYDNFKSNYPFIKNSITKQIFNILKNTNTNVNNEKKDKYKKIIKEMLNDYSFFNALLGDDNDYKKALSQINARASEIHKATSSAVSKIKKP